MLPSSSPSRALPPRTIRLSQEEVSLLCRETTRWHSTPKNGQPQDCAGTQVQRCVASYEGCGHLATMLDQKDVALCAEALHPTSGGSSTCSSGWKVSVAGMCYACRLSHSQIASSPLVRSQVERKAFMRQLKRKATVERQKSAMAEVRPAGEIQAVLTLQSWFRGERVRYWIYCWNLDAIIIQKAFRVMLAARKRRKKERAAVAFVAQAEESATVTNLQKKLQASKDRTVALSVSFKMRIACWLFETALRRRRDFSLIQAIRIYQENSGVRLGKAVLDWPTETLQQLSDRLELVPQADQSKAMEMLTLTLANELEGSALANTLTNPDSNA